jgi:GDP-L-fucose synthase
MKNLLESNILLSGGHGFIGTYVYSKLLQQGMRKEKILIPDRAVNDLRNRINCSELVKDADIIINLAGNVGGIGQNITHPGEMFYDNLMIGVNLIESARIAQKITKFVQIGTICSYPKYTKIPFKEEDLWQGYPEETNAPYGIAKKALLVMLQSYRKQYGFPGIFLLPVNVYGPGDNFDPASSHVIPSLIRKILLAKKNNIPFIEVWGDGSATREFLYVEDAAEAIISATERYDKCDPVNIGAGMEISINDLVHTLADQLDYKGRIIWNTEKPNGQPRRMLDTSKAREEFGFVAKTPFKDGLEKTIKWYLDNHGND